MAVERHGHDPGPEAGPQRFQQVGAVGQDQQEPIAGPEADLAEPAGQPPDANSSIATFTSQIVYPPGGAVST